MQPPKVSVIVITYNQESTIAQCLESILRQKVDFDIEILVGEDCSTDRTGPICEQLAARHPAIRLYRNKQNKGLVDNYFDLVLLARGEYLADCAGDDFWIDPHKLQKQTTLLDTHPKVVLTHTNWNELNTTDNTLSIAMRRSPIGTQPITHGSEFIPALVTQTDIIHLHLCTALYRRTPFLDFYHIHTHLFRAPDLPCEDLQIVFAMCLIGQIAYLNESTLCYRVAPNTVSNPTDKRRRILLSQRLTALTIQMNTLSPQPNSILYTYFQTRFFEQLILMILNESTEQIARTDELIQTARQGLSLRNQFLRNTLRCSLCRKIIRTVNRLRKQLCRQRP